MLKWIASGCLVVILVVVAVSYAGYRRMSAIAAGGPSVSLAIGGTPERVFASLSHSDSIATWSSPGMRLRSSKGGALATGDSIFLIARDDSVPRIVWIVDTVIANQLVASRWVALGAGMVIQRRRDSVAAAGDSTRVTITIHSSMLTDSLASARNQAGPGVASGMLGMASTLSTAGARMQAESDLKRLKARIEGNPVSPP